MFGPNKGEDLPRYLGRYLSTSLEQGIVVSQLWEASRKRGNGRKTYWFEQEMDLNEDEASHATATEDGGLFFQ